MFCVKCGKDDVETINGLCLQCFLNNREIINVPHYINLMRCVNCEEYLINNKWAKKTKNLAVDNNLTLPSKDFDFFNVRNHNDTNK